MLFTDPPVERQEVEDVVVRVFAATDQRDWAGVESCLADAVTLDMTSMTGGEPLRLTPAEVEESPRRPAGKETGAGDRKAP